MAYLRPAKTEDEVKKTTVSQIRKDYVKLAEEYNHLLDLDYIYCPQCGDWKSTANFYSSKETKSGFIHWGCKECIAKAACDYDKKTNIYTDNAEKAQKVLMLLDLPYMDSVYKNAVQDSNNEINEKNRKCGWLQYMTMIQSLPNWRGKKWKDSEFGVDATTPIEFSNRKPRKEIMKIFGSQYSTDELLYLQDQYDEWRSRTQVDSKSQETYIIQICCQLLDIRNARRDGKDTTKLTDGLSKLMGDAKLQPKQNVENAATDSLTFGQLIEKWELEKPISEPLDEFKDPDHIGKYIRVWFKGALARALGLDNGFAQEYDEYVAQYTVDKPHQISNEDEVDESTYSKIFGRSE